MKKIFIPKAYLIGLSSSVLVMNTYEMVFKLSGRYFKYYHNGENKLKEIDLEKFDSFVEKFMDAPKSRHEVRNIDSVWIDLTEDESQLLNVPPTPEEYGKISVKIPCFKIDNVYFFRRGGFYLKQDGFKLYRLSAEQFESDLKRRGVAPSATPLVEKIILAGSEMIGDFPTDFMRFTYTEHKINALMDFCEEKNTKIHVDLAFVYSEAAVKCHDCTKKCMKCSVAERGAFFSYDDKFYHYIKMYNLSLLLEITEAEFKFLKHFYKNAKKLKDFEIDETLYVG